MTYTIEIISRNEKEFRKNPWEYAQKKLQPVKDPVKPSFNVSTAVSHFTQTYSDCNTQYYHLPFWILDTLPNCTTSLFNDTPITPSLVKVTLWKCSMKSTPGWDGITYFHLSHLPSVHHFMATLFNKLLEKGLSPACWGSARIKLIYKMGDPSDPANFCPIALTSVVGKVFHKIISLRLEEYLRRNKVIDASVQKGFITGLPGVFEHVYSLSAILQDATSAKRPLMITFLDLKNTFGSVPHQLIFDMLRTVKVPSKIQCYVESFYSKLFVTVTSKNWDTPPIPFCRGVFQGDTMSPIVFLLAFNPLLKLAADLNQGHGYSIELPLQNSDDFPPLDSSIYVKWVEQGDEPPGWY